MLSRTNRLHSSRDIGRLRASGRSLSFQLFNIRFGGNGLDVARATVVVSSKVSKKATVRNLVKRRIRAGLRELLPRLKAGNDVMVYVKSQAVGATYQELLLALVHALKKARLIE